MRIRQPEKTYAMQNLTNNIKGVLEEGVTSLILSINYGVNSLFLEIGLYINQCIESLPEVEEDDIISKISSSLSPFFGDNLSVENLSLMTKLAQRCSSNGIKYAIVLASWKHIPLFLKLKDGDAWVFYSELIFTDNLSPKQLQDKISKGYFEKAKKTHSGRNVYEFSSYRSLIDMYFGIKDGKKFRKLFEPDEIQTFSNQKLKQILDADNIIVNIQEKILTFQALHNHDLNLTFNLMMWKISYKILEANNSFNTSSTSISVDESIEELRQIFPSVFDEAELMYLLKFAKTERPPTDLLQTVSWPYLKLLVDTELNKQISIANHVLENGLSMQDLRELLSNQLSHPRLEVETINRTSIQREVTKTITIEKDTRIIGSMGIIEENINFKHDLNRNIYKNPKLLKLLEESAHLN